MKKCVRLYYKINSIFYFLTLLCCYLHGMEERESTRLDTQEEQKPAINTSEKSPNHFEITPRIRKLFFEGTGGNKNTALCRAVQNNLSDWVEFFLKRGADINTVLNSETPLHMAVVRDNRKIVKMLLGEKDKIKINMKDNNGRTAFYVAASCGHIEIAEDLWRAGADITLPDGAGDSPLHIASLKGSVEMVNFILSNLGETTNAVNARNTSGKTPLHWATQQNHVGVIKLLIEFGADECLNT